MGPFADWKKKNTKCVCPSVAVAMSPTHTVVVKMVPTEKLSIILGMEIWRPNGTWICSGFFFLPQGSFSCQCTLLALKAHLIFWLFEALWDAFGCGLVLYNWLILESWSGDWGKTEREMAPDGSFPVNVFHCSVYAQSGPVLIKSPESIQCTEWVSLRLRPSECGQDTKTIPGTTTLPGSGFRYSQIYVHMLMLARLLAWQD